jgi:putative phage-type endonuclease
MDQRTPEWFAARLGRVTASRIADVCAKTKVGYGASRSAYLNQLVAEILSGQPQESFTNAAMQWGIDHEAEARDAYSARTGEIVTEVGFVPHQTLQAGASPDGLIGDTGLVEIKCPNTQTHLEYVESRKPPMKYLQQMQFQMACTGRQWCDFVSYDPRLPDNLKLLIVRIQRDDGMIAEIEGIVSEFMMEVNAKVEKLKELKL